MNVIDLFNTPYERALSEGAVDDLEARYIHGLNTKMLDLMNRTRESQYKNDPEALAGLKREYEKIKNERDSFYKIREAKIGQDIVDPREKMRALTPSKPGVAGAVKDVAKGLKNFLQGKPETGPTYEAQKKNLNLSKGVIPTEPLPEHGGGIGPSQRWQDLMPEQNNPEDYDDADEFGMPGSEFFPDEEDDRLRDGDYVRDRQDGEYGEIFRMSGDPSERRVRILDRDGRGWYISPDRLEPVDRNDPDIMKYFGRRRQRDMDEGWSDAVLSRRTGTPRTPYSVYIKGKKWKDFANDDHAEAVANKLKAKFKADGRDPETITIAPTDIDEGVKSSAAATALAACIAAGGTLSGCATNPSVGGAIGTVRDVGTAAKTASTMTRAGVQDELSQELRNFIRAQGGDPGSQNLSLLYKLQKRLQGKKDAPQNINEIKDTEAVEQAILKRIMVAHRDMLMKYGPEKIMTAASDVAYNVGDVGEVGSSDVSGWVKQVEQILGAVNETKTRLDPKCWKGKKIGNPKTKMKGGVRVNNCVPAESVEEDLRDPEDNPCWKGYHPVGTKKKGGKTVPNCVPNAKT